MMDKMWEDATIEERKEVVECYNKYYADNPIPFEICNSHWTGCRWITIKFTFGVKPLDNATIA